MTTQQIADELNKNGWYQKKDGSKIQAFQIHGRTRKYANIFNCYGSICFFNRTNNNQIKNCDYRKPMTFKNKSKVDFDKHQNFI